MNSVKIRIKYFEGATKLKKIDIGNWIDLYANKDMFIPEGEAALIPLGVAMKLPEGYEAIVAPRSSTFKNWGLIQTNSIGVIDNSYCGNNDEWKLPVYCLEGKHISPGKTKGTWIEKGDKICQFRIVKNQPQIMFDTVEELNSPDRGGFGSTGKE